IEGRSNVQGAKDLLTQTFASNPLLNLMGKAMLRKFENEFRTDAKSLVRGSGDTALYEAAQAGQVETMRVLLDAGADINAPSHNSRSEPAGTPLHTAAYKGNFDAVRLLLDRGAKADDTTGGDTPIDRASRHGHEEVAKLLASTGAKLDTKQLTNLLVEA